MGMGMLRADERGGMGPGQPPRSLADAIYVLEQIPELDHALHRATSFTQAMDGWVRDALHAAFDLQDETALTEVHRTLFYLYELHLTDPAVGAVSNQFSTFLTRVRGMLERRWLDVECQRVAGAWRPVTTAEELVQAIKVAVSDHPVARHGLFDGLAADATLAQVRQFFRSGTALNVRFFDLLVMAMVGSLPQVRTELAANFWDEAGRGDPARSHVQLYRRLLDDVGIGQAADEFTSELTWQGLRGYNLFMLCALNRQHYYKLLGVMAATELLDPPQYRKLIAGCRRLGLEQPVTAYYDEHAVIDEVHGQGWLDHVIRPVVERDPQAAREVWLGCMLRLASCQDYYDALCRQLSLTAGVQAVREHVDDHHPQQTGPRSASRTHQDAG